MIALRARRRAVPWTLLGARAWTRALLDLAAVTAVVLLAVLGSGAVAVWGPVALAGCLAVRLLLSVRRDGELAAAVEARVRHRAGWLAEREQWYRALVHCGPDPVTVVGRDGVIRYQNPATGRVLGYPPKALVGRPLTSLLGLDDAAQVLAVVARPDPGAGAVLTLEAPMRDAAGRWRDTESVVINLLDDPAVHGIVITTRDVSARKELEGSLAHRAFHDPLTGLANAALLRDRITHALAARQRDARPLAVLFLDLDGFKQINDSYGHAVGDGLLREVARVIEACVRPGDTVARLGGDEFVVLLEQVDDEVAAEETATRIRAALRDPLTVERRQVQVSVSIGIAIANRGEETVDLLLRNADLAMYRAKANRPSAIVRFEPAMYVALVRRIEDEGLLRHALSRGELRVDYQPTVELQSGRVVGAEALVRWQHPGRGLLLPRDFIPLAEETGVIGEIGAWVLEQACRQAAAWRQAGAELFVAVNLSSRQLRDRRLPALVNSALADNGLAPAALMLEVTESQLTEAGAGAATLTDLTSRGLRIAIDDFGTGYSSLSYLSRFPVHSVKVDRSFVERCAEDGDEAGLTRAIVRLAQSLGLQSVAEGVESAAQLATLRQMGCTHGQGYVFSPPRDAAGILDLVGTVTVPAPRRWPGRQRAESSHE